MKRKHVKKPRPINHTPVNPNRHATGGNIICPDCGGTAHRKTKPDLTREFYWYEIKCPHCDLYIFDRQPSKIDQLQNTTYLVLIAKNIVTGLNKISKKIEI